VTKVVQERTYKAYSDTGTFISLFIFYDSPTPPENVFDGMLSIPAVSNAVKAGSLSELVTSLALPSPSSR
jgi:hypothetical protein